jgi:hypothetical protein
VGTLSAPAALPKSYTINFAPEAIPEYTSSGA